MPRRVVVWLLAWMLLTPGAGGGSQIESVRERVAAWADAWRNRDADRYAAFYAAGFRSGPYDRQAWIERKRTHFESQGEISIRISGLRVALGADRAEASFVQHYKSRQWQDLGEKTLEWIQTPEGWKIVSEIWRPLPAEPDPGPRAAAPAEAPAVPPGSLEVTGLRVAVGADTERLQLDFNRFVMPVFFTLEGSAPRIVVDIEDIGHWSGKRLVPVSGRFVRRVRTYLHRDRHKLRVVLDLYPGKDYAVRRHYDLDRHRYTVTVAVAAADRGSPGEAPSGGP